MSIVPMKKFVGNSVVNELLRTMYMYFVINSTTKYLYCLFVCEFVRSFVCSIVRFLSVCLFVFT